MFLIAGLGNPSSNYKKNRHNAGFILIDLLAEESGRYTFSKKFNADVLETKLFGKDVLLVKPKTFMNNSGESISAVANFYKIEPPSIIILHDEIELDFGLIKHKSGGGHKGHNGLRSIIQQIGSADFNRIRIGVGRPDKDSSLSVADYVLSDFNQIEYEALNNCRDSVLQIIELIIKAG